MSSFQPSPYSYNDYGASEDVAALKEQDPSLATILSGQAAELKDGMLKELRLSRITVTIVAGAVVTVGTGLVAAWLQEKLRRRQEEKVLPGGKPSGALELICSQKTEAP